MTPCVNLLLADVISGSPSFDYGPTLDVSSSGDGMKRHGSFTHFDIDQKPSEKQVEYYFASDARFVPYACMLHAAYRDNHGVQYSAPYAGMTPGENDSPNTK